ncbi:protein PLASTID TRANSCRIPTIONALLY ACTIVE 7 isoform X2 [Andrographis paniculata]|uniref:protein PLASTID TRANSCRIPTIONALLY ACTIVE 7 isoform X2 n=1 Tax=Andrographis paniculata TaxID=175694 RepID=UPI0021E73821|nr:protein PLASTID TRANSCRIPTIONALLY ACTIVE 7 isoform X2 [Andrographis paniculata]
MATVSASFSTLTCLSCVPKIEVKTEKKWQPCRAVRSQDSSNSTNSGRSHRKVWRRRKLSKRDAMLDYKTERVPFLEEQVRKIKETGNILTMDIETLLLSEDNRYEFVNEIAAEAKRYVENNRDEYGGAKKAILHVISNRINDAGIYRPDAYIEDDPFKPGPGYLRQELYDA